MKDWRERMDDIHEEWLRGLREFDRDMRVLVIMAVGTFFWTVVMFVLAIR